MEGGVSGLCVDVSWPSGSFMSPVSRKVGALIIFTYTILNFGPTVPHF